MSKKDEQYGKKKAQQRFEDALRGAFKTQPKPLKEIQAHETRDTKRAKRKK